MRYSRRTLLRGSAALAGWALSGHLLKPGAARRAYAATTDGTLGFRGAIELAALIRGRHIGSEELTRYFIHRIERYDERLNAVVVRDFERALEAAKAADAALARGEVAGPLHGLPMTIKESYDIAGIPTTWGVPDLRGPG
jgi:amidase